MRKSFVTLLTFCAASWLQLTEARASTCGCIGRASPIGVTSDQRHFYASFKNSCGTAIYAPFDVLLFWCTDQASGGGCASESSSKTMPVRTTVWRQIGPYGTVTIYGNIPPGARCGRYQWDINYKPSGCTTAGSCYLAALKCNATQGQKFTISRNCVNCVQCCPGQSKGCPTGCGVMTCGSNGYWNTSGCWAKNSCGTCGKQPQCCSGQTKRCSSGCGTVTCKNGSWNTSGCTAKNKCGTCGAQPQCCKGQKKKCSAGSGVMVCGKGGKWDTSGCSKPQPCDGGGAGGNGAAGDGGANGGGGDGAGGGSGDGVDAGSPADGAWTFGSETGGGYKHPPQDMMGYPEGGCCAVDGWDPLAGDGGWLLLGAGLLWVLQRRRRRRRARA